MKRYVRPIDDVLGKIVYKKLYVRSSIEQLDGRILYFFKFCFIHTLKRVPGFDDHFWVQQLNGYFDMYVYEYDKLLNKIQESPDISRGRYRSHLSMEDRICRGHINKYDTYYGTYDKNSYNQLEFHITCPRTGEVSKDVIDALKKFTQVKDDEVDIVTSACSRRGNLYIYSKK